MLPALCSTAVTRVTPCLSSSCSQPRCRAGSELPGSPVPGALTLAFLPICPTTHILPDSCLTFQRRRHTALSWEPLSRVEPLSVNLSKITHEGAAQSDPEDTEALHQSLLQTGTPGSPDLINLVVSKVGIASSQSEMTPEYRPTRKAWG